MPKGYVPWNKSKTGIYSEETLEKMRKAAKKRIGSKNPNWRGGKKQRNQDGRRYIYNPDHPFANKDGYVLHSRLIAEKYLGHYLTRREVVHHINGNPSDDRPENLYVFPSSSEHKKFEGNQYLKSKENKPKLKSNLFSSL